jgi:hypothetical protein
MKQPEDNMTLDMHDPVQEAAPGAVITPDNPNSKPTYRFFINTERGATLAWSGLTLREAKAMNKLMDKHNPLQSNVNVLRHGWEEVK